jgi:cytochrome P450
MHYDREKKLNTQLNDVPEVPLPREEECPFRLSAEYSELQRSDGMVRVRLEDGSTAWLVTRFKEHREILNDPGVSAVPTLAGFPHRTAARRNQFEEFPHLSNQFNFLDDPDHQVIRRMLTRSFALRRMELLRPRIQSIVDDLIDNMLASGTEADLVESFALPLPSLVICELLGAPYSDREIFQACSRVLVDASSSADEARLARSEFMEYIYGLIRAKEAKPGDDLLSRLLADHVSSGAISRDDLATNALLLLLAGHETTANMIALGTVALLSNPTQLDLVRSTDDPKVIAAAVEELLRYLSIVEGAGKRVALSDLRIGDLTVRAGEGIMASVLLGNHDPRKFDDPESLDVKRDAREHVAFGFGPHQCLGQPLARVELQVVLATLYRRIPNLRLAVPFEQLDFRTPTTIVSLKSVPVAWG